LTFANKEDYDRIDACDSIDTNGLWDVLKNNGQGEIRLEVRKRSGESFTIPVKHTLSKDQCGFILAGSALNLLAKRHRAE
jgi:homoaconitase